VKVPPPVQPPASTFPGGGTFTAGTILLQPGTYSGPLVVSGTASVTLAPGIYYLRGGLSVSGGGRVSGTGVLLYFPALSPSSGLSITSGGQVTLSAPTGGTYQGIAVWENRSSGVPVAINNGMLNVTGSVYGAMAAINVSNGGVLTMQGSVSQRLAARLIALDMSVASGMVTIDASANPDSLP
jgi:hypothetical protein